MKKFLALGVLVLVLLPGCGKKPEETKPAEAAGIPGVPADMQVVFTQFGSALERQDYTAAFLSLRSAIENFWGITPLLLQNERFVKSDGNTFGIFEPKDTDEYAAGEPMYLYLEPVGFGVKKSAEGKYEFGFNVDFSLESEKGEILGGQKGFANMPFSSWNFNTEIALTFTYTFSGLEKGRYKIITTVRDAVSDKSATCEKWFSVT
jgi:hypothetical protein